MNTRLLIIIVIVCLAIVMPAMLSNHIQIVYHEKSIRENNVEDLEMIQQILKKCADPNKDKLSYELGLAFRNQTHYIDNNTCEWESLVYPPPAHLESENSTHVGLGYEN